MITIRSGRIAYFQGIGESRRCYGGERFSITTHRDAQRTLTASCEIRSGAIGKRHVVREVSYSMGAGSMPFDCYVKLHKDGCFLGSAWFRFSSSTAEAELFSAEHGRISQRIELTKPVSSFGAHALICDATHLAQYDHDKGGVQKYDGAMLSSLEHDGCSGPLLSPVSFDMEYVGREIVEIPAGRFETDHYRYLFDNSPTHQDHPTEEIWCLPDDYTLIRAEVRGYMDSSFELVELETATSPLGTSHD